ncbi:hypothetical protein HELRODRAFT_99580 [Helobdella robusta]|uniref:Transmembrane protein 65 n=1 Tax=Helobdella robusta TaxID=6412 RepID=T1G9T8_HELRO|nr:hypothetical protein HELRODRAFT_99580 [Helobdella robusta]ESO04693.1 hypothetical protein HELRODRAFT_99580 [Helobdella robusta]
MKHLITLQICSSFIKNFSKNNVSLSSPVMMTFRHFSDLPQTKFFTTTTTKNTLPRNSGHWKWPTTNVRDPRARGGNRVWYPPISSEDDARNLALHLDPTGRKLLMDQLRIIDDKKDESSFSVRPIPTSEIFKVFLTNCLPFIGFGFLDNGIMIIAGEYIDIQLGLLLGISTMAAAALGNLISDLAGVGTAGYIENIVEKFSSIQPNLSPAEFHLKSIRWMTAMARAIGITIGCLIGMLPLLFFEKKERPPHKPQPPQQQQPEIESPLSPRRQEVMLLNQPINK